MAGCGCIIVLWIFPLTFGGILISVTQAALLTPVIHPDCTLLPTSKSTPPSFCITLPRCLNFFLTCKFWELVAQHLHASFRYVPFRHNCSALDLDILIPLFSSASLHISASSSSLLLSHTAQCRKWHWPRGLLSYLVSQVVFYITGIYVGQGKRRTCQVLFSIKGTHTCTCHESAFDSHNIIPWQYLPCMHVTDHFLARTVYITNHISEFKRCCVLHVAV